MGFLGVGRRIPSDLNVYVCIKRCWITTEVWYNLFQIMKGNVTILIIPFNKNNPTTTRGEYRRESCYSDRKFKRIQVQLYYAIDIQFRKIAWNQNWILRLTVPSEWDFLAGKADTENHCKYRKIYEKESISWLPTPSNEWERKSKICMHIKSYIIISTCLWPS
jgi:hypothetical protein